MGHSRLRIESFATFAPLASIALASACAELSSMHRAQSASHELEAARLASFVEIRAPGMPTLASDGSVYVRDWPDGVPQLYRIDADGEHTTRLSSFQDGLSSYSLSPNGEWLVLAAATGGNEQDQLYLLDTRGLEARAAQAAVEPTPLCSDPRVAFRFQMWLSDSSGFVYAANDEAPASFHLYRCDLRGGAGGDATKTKLLARDGSWSARDITRDGSRLLIGRFVSESEAHAYELDVASSALRELAIGDPSSTSNTAAIGYLPGERTVLLESDADGGTRRVWSFDLETGRARRPMPAFDAFELDSAEMNDDRDLLAFTNNQDGYGVLQLVRLPGFEPVVLPAIETGVVTVASLRGRNVVWTLSNARTPGLAFVYETPTGGEVEGARACGVVRTLTRADTRGLDLGHFAVPELVHYRSFDGREIPAFVFLPKSAHRGAPVPFVVEYHGGPESQHRPDFDRVAQVLVARGFGVMQPNVRGSTGYGKAFHQLDDYKLRWDSVKDGVEAARWLVDQGLAKHGEIASYGGSYGGYMSVATVIEGGDLFGAAVDVVGIVNMETFLAGTKEYRRKLREAEYGPLSDAEFLRSISPLVRADEIRVPMLIAHGLNDPRVPVGEAMQLAVGLQRRGLDPEILVFPDEGHGFQKLANRLLFTERMVRFLERTIGVRSRAQRAREAIAPS